MTYADGEAGPPLPAGSDEGRADLSDRDTSVLGGPAEPLEDDGGGTGPRVSAGGAPAGPRADPVADDQRAARPLAEGPVTGDPIAGDAVAGDAVAGHSISGDHAHGGGEEYIVYPERPGTEALGRLGTWALGAMRRVGPEGAVTFIVVMAAVLFTFHEFQPSNLFRNTTISGGDTGAHVLLPWVALHQLLPHFRLTGWTSSNWDGFPAITFYFPLPIYAIVGLGELIRNDEVAFKLLTAAPMIFMPVAGWLLGKLSRAPYPIPAVLAAGTLPFIFGTEFSIYGGNIPSTLAGEFAFGWALWFALVFLGVVSRGLQTGKGRAWAAVLFACTFMSHIDPTMFAVAGAAVLILTHALRYHDWRGAFWWSLPTFVVGGLLTAWWALPFKVRFPYVTNMGYTRNTAYLSSLFPQGTNGATVNDTWLFILAGMGAVLCLARRRRTGELLTILAVLSAVAFRYMPQSILWNNRVLPFWFLSLYLLAALAVAELYSIMAERMTGFVATLRGALVPGPLLVLLLALVWVGFPLRVLPGENTNAAGQTEFLGIPQKAESYIPSWVSWNYSGYQYSCTTSVNCDEDDVKARWPEYEEIVTQLEAMSKKYGCGSVDWEYQSQMNDYGTPDALTILPYWTDGCIGSMEGLYYESSATTPFHFINQSELSLAPSDPMVGIPYSSGPNVTLGVEHLQMLGVKYYMALNTEVQKQAAADPSLKLIDTFGPFSVNYAGDTSGPTGVQQQYWKLYLVKDAARVHPLADQPVVMAGLNNSSQPKYLQVMTGFTAPGATSSPATSTGWYETPSEWDVYLASSGPSNWQRVPYGSKDLPVTPEPSTTVSHVVEHNASISFNVSRLHVPVVVTISYFPNWQVTGAQGVYRVSPNLMVVVPTSHHVSLWYGYTPVDYEGYGLTLLAVVGLFFLARRPLAPVVSVRRPQLGRRAGLGPIGRAILDRLGALRAGPPEPEPGPEGEFVALPDAPLPAPGQPGTSGNGHFAGPAEQQHQWGTARPWAPEAAPWAGPGPAGPTVEPSPPASSAPSAEPLAREE